MPYRTAFFVMAFVAVVTPVLPLSLLVIDHVRLEDKAAKSEAALIGVREERMHYEKSYRELLQRIGPVPHRPTGAVGNAGDAPSR
jgi:hypothetical protein